MVRAVRVAGAVASALVLLVTGYGWTAYRELGARLVTSDVLTRDRPADGVIDILLVGLDSRTSRMSITPSAGRSRVSTSLVTSPAPSSR